MIFLIILLIIKIFFNFALFLKEEAGGELIKWSSWEFLRKVQRTSLFHQM